MALTATNERKDPPPVGKALILFHLGLDAREVMLIESLLSSAPSLEGSFVFQEPPPGRHADIILVNADDSLAVAKWEVIRRSSPYTRGILISNNEQPESNQRTVQRPLTLRKFEGVLKELKDDLSSASDNSTTQTSGGSGRLEILIVDDSLQAREFLKMKLEELLADTEIAISECADGESALPVAREKAFDLIFLDVEMPGMSGFEACEHIRKFSNARIVMLTSKSMADDFRQGSSAGCNHYLVKPPNDQDVKVILSLTQLKKA